MPADLDPVSGGDGPDGRPCGMKSVWERDWFVHSCEDEIRALRMDGSDCSMVYYQVIDRWLTVSRNSCLNKTLR